MPNLRPDYLIDPTITFLNHGSFGATSKAVFDMYQNWQRELERQPVEFLGRRATSLIAEARGSLGSYLGANPDDLVFTQNVTIALNMVARSFEFGPGDEVLSTNHEYGAIDKTWRYLARKRGFRYINQPIPLPMTTPSDFIDALWKGKTERTRAIFLSHITSPTALIFPVADVVRRARAEGILTIVDGAHAPGQIDLHLEQLGVDFYGGNLHKWLSAPKGAGFLYVRREIQKMIKPLVVSWGFEPEIPGLSRFIDENEWWGTRDLAAFLSVPAAIEYQRQHHWEYIRRECHGLAGKALKKICAITHLEPLSGEDGYAQMVAVPLPDMTNLESLKSKLYDTYRIEVPMIQWNGRKFVRISIQGYNTGEDVERLVSALQDLL